MQLLDSCALPEAQFATLTVLLQLNDIYDSQHGNQNVSGLSSEKDERGESSHSLPPPEDGDQNSESRDTEGNHCEKNEDDEADKSAGSTNNPLYENEDYRSRNKTKSNLWRHPKRRTEPMTHAVLRESMTVISPTTLLPEGAHSRSMESLEIHLMQEFGFRDDFRRIGGPPSDVYRDNEESCDTIVDHDHGKRGESEQDQHDVENNLECDDGGELNGRNGRSNSRVRFHTDTKDGAMDDSNVVSEKNAPSLLQNRKMMEYEDTSFPFENQLAVKSYSPPSFHLNCSLGLTLFYVTVFVEDIGELSEGCNGIIQDGQLSIEKDTTKTLKHCAAVLLPNVSWQKTHSQFATASRMEGKRGGMVILTVGITGPAYDLYGASPVVANLPQRLRECVRTLSALNTVSPSHIVKLKDAGKQTEHRSSPQQQKHASPKRSFIKTKSKPSSYRKDIVTDPSSRQSHQPTSLIAYDHSYFRQLYRALLASLLNDDDGYLSSRNIAPSNSSDFGMPGGVISSHKIDGSVHSHQSSSPTIDSESSIPPNHDSGSSGGGKKKLFTFSRKRNSRTTTGYETGDSISSGTPQDNKNDASDASFPSDRFSSQVPKAAEIVERMSLQLEVLSLAEEDMALPLYSKYECSADMLSVGNVERKRLLPSTSPKVSLASHGGTTHVSGRFGKPAAPSDLSGFDFKPKPSSSRPHVMNSAGSVSGLSSTSLMGSVSDDASILTGNDTATTSKFTASSSSQSSVPTLSKSKRDLMTTSSRSLFVQRRKAAAVVAASPTRAGVEANAGPSKPPLFPHERQTVPMPLFDPFGVEQNEDICDDVSKEKRNDDNAEEALSIASVSTKDTAISGSAPPSPLSRINGTISNSSSRDGSDVGDEHSLPQEHGPSIKGPLVRLDVALALNEDLTCEYKKSKLSTLSVEGTLQVSSTRCCMFFDFSSIIFDSRR